MAEKQTLHRSTAKVAAVSAQWVALIAVLVVNIASVADRAQPEIASSTIPAIECVYRQLKSDGALRSIDVYAIDDFRSALEYTFRDKDGQITADIILTASGHGRSTYAGMLPPKSPQRAWARVVDFLSRINLDSRCPVTPAFDDVLPRPKPRNLWLRVTWPDRTP